MHPAVYRAIVGFVVLFLAAAWAGASGGRTAFLIGAATLFFAVVLILWWASKRVWRATDLADDERTGTAPFREWVSQDIGTHAGPVRGGEAALEILLPIAAVAVGLTALTIVAAVVAAEN